MTPFTVLHWNIHSWIDDQGEPNDERVADLIRRTEPDIVSLVEVNEVHGEPSVLRRVAAAGGYVPVFCPAFEFGDVDGPRGAFGNALLTRLPVLEVRHRHLVWPVPTYDGTEGTEARTVTLVTVRTATGPLTAGTTHLPRGNATTRQDALTRLAGIVHAAGSAFVAGDFNTAPDWVRDCGLTAVPDMLVTYPGVGPLEPIDYLVTSSPLHLVGKVLNEPGSDHLPVLASGHLPAS